MKRKYTVLYADDDYDDIFLLQEVFDHHSQNIELITFNNGLELISYIKQQSLIQPLPCLIILDINMPMLNGRDTLVQLRNMDLYKNVPVFMFTTSSSKLDKDFAFKYNAGFLTKPINVVQLETIANIFIEHCPEDIRDHLRKQKV